MNPTQDKKHSSAVYAAAGIGDLAYEQLKKIPAFAEELRTKAGSLREQGPDWRTQATDKAAQLAGRVDVEKIRTTLIANAQKAAEKAASFYDELVARGEKLVDADAQSATAKAADKVADGAAMVFDGAVKISEDATAKAEAATPKPDAAGPMADGIAKAAPRKKATGKAPGTAK
jgi:heparin binding hemagglutinin HbhA